MFGKVIFNPILRTTENNLLRQISLRFQSASTNTSKNLLKFETLSVTVPKPFVYHVVLNRPKKLNAFSLELMNDINNCFDNLDKDEDCRVILVSGAGKMFSAGLDFSAITVLGEKLSAHEDVARRCKAFREFLILGQNGTSAPEKCIKPVISLVHSGCVGLGTNFIATVDIRYCTEDAYFQVKEIELGMAADMGALQRLPRIIGSASLANELCLTGRKFPAQEALQSGLVSKVFKDKESMVASGLELAESLAQKSPVGLQMTKRSILYSRDHGVEDGLRHIADWNQIMLQSEDFMNAAMALATKSPPPEFAKL